MNVLCYSFVIISLDLGDDSAGEHLLPFRTEKLRPVTPMVLRKRESRKSPICFYYLFGIFIYCYVSITVIVNSHRTAIIMTH